LPSRRVQESTPLVTVPNHRALLQEARLCKGHCLFLSIHKKSNTVLAMRLRAPYYRLRSGSQENMSAKKDAEGLENLIREISIAARDRDATTSVRRGSDRFRSFARRDYSAALRRHFDQRQLREIFTEMRSALPALNQKVFETLDVRRLAEIATELGAVLQAKPFGGSQGRSLRGFYASDRALPSGPLIFVNTAIHPVGVAAAFWHEVGHHLVKRIFDSPHARRSLSFSMNYENHLNDPEEIAADMLMVLACYPQRAANRLFGTSGLNSHNKDPGLLVSRARPYIHAVTGWDFEKNTRSTENLQRLAGMIHVAKLRATLLSEYEI
jgi:hypothetical protein